ncbi:MAG: hypothetical protein GYA85_08375 [Propionibacterium sp.]|nr:hypothetical protein [Propionibacterium sp.]
MSNTTILDDVTTAIVLLGDADEELRLRAAVDLGTWQAAEAAPALVARLGIEPSHAIRETLSWALLRMPAAARPLLRAALGEPDWLARMQACHVLSKLGDRDDAAALLPLIADPVDAVASRAWWAAGQTGSPTVTDALAAQLGRGDSELRNSLSIAFEELRDLGVVALARRLRRDEAAGVREHAADTLGLIGSPYADPAILLLREATDDPDPMVRFAALNALGQLDSPRARAAVRAVSDANDPRLRRLAERLVRRHRPEPAPIAPEPTDRPLPVGVVAAAPGVLVGLACESGLLAESRTLPALAGRIATLAAADPDLDRAGLLAAALPDGSTVREALAALSARAGERIGLAAVERLDGTVAHAVHTAADGSPVGVLLGHTGSPGPDTDRIVAKVLLQVALCRARYLASGDVPAHVWRDVREAAQDRAAADGLTGALGERAVAGAVADYAVRNVLLQQVSITDPGVTIDALLYGRGIRITGFRRLTAGDRR